MMTETSEPPKPPCYLEPYPGESVSHYFGRFRRQPSVSIAKATSLSRSAKMGPVLFKWEQFYFSPPPKRMEIEAIVLRTRYAIAQVILLNKLGLFGNKAIVFRIRRAIVSD